MAVSRIRRLPDLPSRVAALLAASLGEASLAGRRLAVGFSGGRDSVCLLHLVHSLRAQHRFDLRAVHVHHGLSAHADAWATQAAAFCAALAIPFEQHRVAVDVQGGEGIEAAARRARYQVFCALDVDAVLLGHHREDQAETLLLNLLRGCGVAGAAAMPAARLLSRDIALRKEAVSSPLFLLRPLLDVPRADIESYVAHHGLPFVDDESNADARFRRNFLRAEVLPQIRRRFPGADAQLARAAVHFSDAAVLLEDLAVLDLAYLATSAGLDCRALAALSEARQSNVLRHWLAAAGERAMSAALSDEVLRQLHSARPDVETQISFHSHDLRVWRGHARLLAKTVGAPMTPVLWQGEPSLPWAGELVRFSQSLGEGLARERCRQLELRPRQGGERLRLTPGGTLRTVKRLLQEGAVPPWERSRLPFLWSGSELLGVVGLGMAAGCLAAPGEPGVLVEWGSKESC